MNLGTAICKCRKARGIPQFRLAELADVSVSHLCLIEKNKRDPSISTVTSIADALNVPLSILVIIAAEQNDIHELSQSQLDDLSAGLIGLMNGSKKQQSLF